MQPNVHLQIQVNYIYNTYMYVYMNIKNTSDGTYGTLRMICNLYFSLSLSLPLSLSLAVYRARGQGQGAGTMHMFEIQASCKQSFQCSCGSQYLFRSIHLSIPCGAKVSQRELNVGMMRSEFLSSHRSPDLYFFNFGMLGDLLVVGKIPTIYHSSFS